MGEEMGGGGTKEKDAMKPTGRLVSKRDKSNGLLRQINDRVGGLKERNG